MKTKISFLILALILLNSCIVKSLYPFFTKNTIAFENRFIGSWTDSEKNEWKIVPLKEKIKDENKGDAKSTQEDYKIFNGYLDGYYIERTEKEIKSSYLAVPFKLNNQLFIDFLPFTPEFEFKNVPELAQLHFVTAHSLVKVDFKDDNNINLRWLDSDKLEKLLTEKRIKIKYTKTFDVNAYLLTATSEDLQRFIKKYMTSNEENKWSTDIEFDLKRKDVKP